MNARTIRQTNNRLAVAILSVRIQGRNPATMAEFRDAINFRHFQRHATLTKLEAKRLALAYARHNCPDLILTMV